MNVLNAAGKSSFDLLNQLNKQKPESNFTYENSTGWTVRCMNVLNAACKSNLDLLDQEGRLSKTARNQQAITLPI